ncbi:MAG TPA: hypothetical protein ENK66_01860 [Arcobacter sp.]|jgi:formate hydrogenlyase subunit 3/multisubunit Na+/H+ antiporter MnhD subunit|nr:hypothetical protein [Arcobacter sp.]
MLKLGVIALIIGFLLILFLTKFSMDKKVLKNFGIAFGIILMVYGLIQIIQPSDDTYIETTKTTTPHKH